MITCKYCKQRNLHWVDTVHGWRLYYGDGPHKCNKFVHKRKRIEREKNVHNPKLTRRKMSREIETICPPPIASHPPEQDLAEVSRYALKEILEER